MWRLNIWGKTELQSGPRQKYLRTIVKFSWCCKVNIQLCRSTKVLFWKRKKKKKSHNWGYGVEWGKKYNLDLKYSQFSGKYSCCQKAICRHLTFLSFRVSQKKKEGWGGKKCRLPVLYVFSSCQPLITKKKKKKKDIGCWGALILVATNGCHPACHLISITKGVFLSARFQTLFFPPSPPPHLFLLFLTSSSSQTSRFSSAQFNIYISTLKLCQFGQVLDAWMLMAPLLKF